MIRRSGRANAASAGVLLAGAAALLPSAALSASAAPAAPPQDARPDSVQRRNAAFAPPPSGFVLTRELRRPLTGGREIVVRRSYQVEITREGQGFIVNGTIIASDVDAPAGLDRIAELERNRPDNMLFPFRLDGQGMIVDPAPAPATPAPAPASAPASGEPVDRAGEMVGMWASRISFDSAERGHIDSFMQQLKSRGARAQWPRDLFRPAPGPHVRTDSFVLPGGDHGSVTVSTAARTREGSGLMERVERTVVTDYGDSKQVTHEIWRLDMTRPQP